MMGMPITVEIVSPLSPVVVKMTLDRAFEYFSYVENKFSVYRENSEISEINRGTISINQASADMQEIFLLAEMTKKETDGYFDIVNRKGIFDPSGIVKGWAIYNVAKLIKTDGFENFFVDAGGDIQVNGFNQDGERWRVGIENPFDQGKYVKKVTLTNQGIATSGTYIRGQHIYNPKQKDLEIKDIVSLSVIGPNVFEADRFATSVFAMGREGIIFLEKQKNLEGYIITSDGKAVMTSGFEKYVIA